VLWTQCDWNGKILTKTDYFLDPEQKKYIKVHQNAHHWIFADLAIDEYRLSESNIFNLCRKFLCKERNVIGMVKFRWKGFFLDPEQKKYTKKYINLLRVGYG